MEVAAQQIPDGDEKEGLRGRSVLVVEVGGGDLNDGCGYQVAGSRWILRRLRARGGGGEEKTRVCSFSFREAGVGM
jgi:hypothetical protein